MKIVNESKSKHKLWVNSAGTFYNKRMQEWLDDNDMLTTSTHNQGK